MGWQIWQGPTRNLSVLDWQLEARQHTLACLKGHELPTWEHLNWHPRCLSSKACVAVRGVKQPGNKADVAAALAGVARHQSVGFLENICLHCCHACCSHYSSISASCCVGVALNWCSIALCTADSGYLEIKKSLPCRAGTQDFFFRAILLQCVCNSPCEKKVGWEREMLLEVL